MPQYHECLKYVFDYLRRSDPCSVLCICFLVNATSLAIIATKGELRQ